MSKIKNKSLFNIYLIYFISMLLFTVVRVLANFGVFNGLHDQVSSLVFTIIIQLFIMFLVPMSLFILFKIVRQKKQAKQNNEIINVSVKKEVKDVFKLTGFKKISAKVLLISVLLGVCAFLLNIVVSSIFNGIIGAFGYNFSQGGGNTQLLPFSKEWQLLFDLIIIAVFPAFCEEFLHRGLLLHGAQKIGYKKSILISSLLFGLIHFNIQQVSYAFILGLLIAFVAVISKSIWPAIIMHFLNNAISVYLGFANKHGWFGGNFYELLEKLLTQDNIILAYLTNLTLVIMLLFTTYLLIVKLFKESTLNKVQKTLANVMSEDFITPNESGVLTTQKEKEIIVSSILLNNSNINVLVTKETNPIDIMLPVVRDKVSATFIDNIFLYASIILGGLVTAFTFIWGIL